MNVRFIIAQLIGIVVLFFTLKAFNQEKKKDYAINSLLTAVFNIVHYLLLNAYSGVTTKAVAFFRTLLIYNREKNKKYNNIIFYILFMLIYIALAIVNYNNNIINLLPFVAAILYFTTEWFYSVFTIKVFALITSFMWLAYNIIFLSITGTIHNVIMIVSLSIIIYKDIKKRKTGGKRGKKKH